MGADLHDLLDQSQSLLDSSFDFATYSPRTGPRLPADILPAQPLSEKKVSEGEEETDEDSDRRHSQIISSLLADTRPALASPVLKLSKGSDKTATTGAVAPDLPPPSAISSLNASTHSSASASNVDAITSTPAGTSANTSVGVTIDFSGDGDPNTKTDATTSKTTDANTSGSTAFSENGSAISSRDPDVHVYTNLDGDTNRATSVSDPGASSTTESSPQNQVPPAWADSYRQVLKQATDCVSGPSTMPRHAPTSPQGTPSNAGSLSPRTPFDSVCLRSNDAVVLMLSLLCASIRSVRMPR